MSTGETLEVEAAKQYTKEEVREFLSVLSERVVSKTPVLMHSMIALNTLLRLDNSAELFDDELKGQARDLWLKFRSTGFELSDPPFLFGLPEDFGIETAAADASADDEQELEIPDRPIRDEDEDEDDLDIDPDAH